MISLIITSSWSISDTSSKKLYKKRKWTKTETNIEMHNGKYQCHTPASRTYHLPSLSHSTWACMAYWICLFHILIKKMVENFLQKESREWTIRKKRQDRKSRTRQKNESGDRKRESHDSPASPDRKVPRHPSFPLQAQRLSLCSFKDFISTVIKKCQTFR